jgi:head-tail adaptor
VSRRDPNRRKVDIWTSLNRVWASKHPLALQAICRALAERSDSLAAVQADLSRELEPAERKHVRAVADHLSGIVKREREEHGL